MGYEIKESIDWAAEHIMHSVFPVGQNAGIIFDNADDIFFRDINGKEYIDGSSQLICANLGYGQQEIVEAAKQQMQKLPYNSSFWGHCSQPLIDCGRMLAELTPKALDYFHFTSGGSDSTETAFRLARHQN